MQTRRLTITRRRASRRAPVARLTVTIAGSSCGVRPTAIASANRADWRSERPSATLITKIEPASTTVTVASSREKACSPCWNAVCPCRSPKPQRDRAERGVRARADDERRARPAAHERAHERARRQVERRVAQAGARLPSWPRAATRPSAPTRRTRARAPPAGADRPGTTSPTRRCTTSPGTISVTSTSTGCPSRSTKARCRIWECSASTAFSERYSLKKLSPMLIAMIPPMISASVRSPTTAETTAAKSSSTSR